MEWMVLMLIMASSSIQQAGQGREGKIRIPDNNNKDKSNMIDRQSCIIIINNQAS